MLKYFSAILVICFTGSLMAQLTEAAQPTSSSFKANYWKNKVNSNDKKIGCAVDTLYYARYNSTNNRFLNLSPGASSPQLGIGKYF